MDEKKKRPFIKFHAVQALAVNVILWIVVIVLGFIPVVGCISPFVWLVLIWPAILAYQGKYFEVPVVTKFLRGQHWIS
jgi:uncharacterized membrane protein